MEMPYIPPQKRQHIFPAWVRYPIWFVIAIIIMKYSIHWFFAMMPMAEAALLSWVSAR